MNFGKIPSVPNIPAPPAISAAPPTHVGQDVGRGPLKGNVGVGVPQHFDPNNPTVAVDATIHNPTGIGGDLHIQKDVPIPTHVPDLHMPSMGSGSGRGGGSGGFGMPSLPDISLPDMPSMPDLSLPDMPSMPDLSLPSLGSGGGGFGLPSLGMPSLSGLLPGMPGFRFPDLPKIELPALDLSEWDLSMPDLIPDWGGSSEEERQEPHKRAKHQDRLTVELELTTHEGFGLPFVHYEISGKDHFSVKGTLDKHGKAKEKIPRGPYTVRYPNHEEIYFKGIALELQDAIAKNAFHSAIELLDEERHDLKMAFNFYDCYLASSSSSIHQDLLDLARKHDQVDAFELLWSTTGAPTAKYTHLLDDEEDDPDSSDEFPTPPSIRKADP